MIHIAICDDDSQEQELVESLVKEYNEDKPCYDIIVHRFSTSLDMLSYVEEHGGFDVLFLDVFMYCARTPLPLREGCSCVCGEQFAFKFFLDIFFHVPKMPLGLCYNGNRCNSRSPYKKMLVEKNNVMLQGIQIQNISQ